MLFKVISVDVAGHGHGMFGHLPGVIGRVDTIDQKAWPHAHAGEHAGEKIGIVAIVVGGIGENVDEQIRAFHTLSGLFAIMVFAPGAGIDIRCVQQHHIG